MPWNHRASRCPPKCTLPGKRCPRTLMSTVEMIPRVVICRALTRRARIYQSSRCRVHRALIATDFTRSPDSLAPFRGSRSTSFSTKIGTIFPLVLRGTSARFTVQIDDTKTHIPSSRAALLYRRWYFPDSFPFSGLSRRCLFRIAGCQLHRVAIIGKSTSENR